MLFFSSIDRMPFLAPTLDNADSLFTLEIIQGFYLHNLQVADQDPASDSLYISLINDKKNYHI